MDAMFQTVLHRQQVLPTLNQYPPDCNYLAPTEQLRRQLFFVFCPVEYIQVRLFGSNTLQTSACVSNVSVDVNKRERHLPTVNLCAF